MYVQYCIATPIVSCAVDVLLVLSVCCCDLMFAGSGLYFDQHAVGRWFNVGVYVYIVKML